MKDEKMYMDVMTGHVGTYDDWFYTDEYGTPQNAVDKGEVVEVYKVHGEWEGIA